VTTRTHRRRAPIHQTVETVYAWIAAINGREFIAVVDVPAPGGIGSRPMQLAAPRRTDADRMQRLARQLLDDSQSTPDPLRDVSLVEFHRANPTPPLVVLQPTVRALRRKRPP
jgi:hypothetical protein